MAQIALPRHQATQSQSAAIGAPLYQSCQHASAGPVDLLPNPDFSFPMRAPDAPFAEPRMTTRPLSLQAYPSGRRGSMSHHRQKSVSALPAFSFNPAGATGPDAPPSPPRPLSLLPTTPTKPGHGHRRGGSEFIGGDIRPGGSTVISSSPTKADGFLCTPDSARIPGPPAGRRGHAHRRSGAISSHDLTSIMSPPPPSRTGSAPNTPAKGNPFVFGHSVNRSISQPSLRESNPANDADARPPSRARVGFADRVEYIRPLSTISSETETSLSTLRGHSATNSLSSMVGGSSPQTTRPARPPLSTVDDETRPSTAGAVLDSFMSSPLSGAPTQRKRPMSAISPVMPTGPIPRVPTKRRGFFRLESRRSDHAVHSLPTSLSDPSLSKSSETPLVTPAADEESAASTDKIKSTSRKAGKRPRKVKSWANSIIPRKSRKNKQAKAKASLPPLGSVSDGEEDDTDTSDDMDFVPNFDEDTTVTIVAPSAITPPELKLNTSYASWQPRQLKRVDSDLMSPIIDLDAALGPFNTPTGSSPRSHQRGFSANKRVLHSASGLASSHRRTESAPELVPFDFRPSTATAAAPMADVFEEEEPEDDPPISGNDSQPISVSENTNEPIIVEVEAEDTQEGAEVDWDFSDGLGIQRDQTGTASSLDSLPLCTAEEDTIGGAELELSPEPTAVEVVEDFEEPRASSLTRSSDSTITLQPTSDSSKTQCPINLPLPLSQQNIMTPDTVASSFPSPDYSFETPRAGTSASSMTDYPTMPSPRFGEPGPELRNSVDDVPSLTSSRSTMTSALQNAFPLASPRRFGDRTASLYSDPSELESRRGKRSSIASLSRLINSSSHSERSKLSIEQRPQSEHLEPLREKKKNNRLSKLKFWKSSKDP